MYLGRALMIMIIIVQRPLAPIASRGNSRAYPIGVVLLAIMVHSVGALCTSVTSFGLPPRPLAHLGGLGVMGCRSGVRQTPRGRAILSKGCCRNVSENASTGSSSRCRFVFYYGPVETRPLDMG